MMKHDRSRQVGLDRLIRLEWLERVANILLGGSDEHTIKIKLKEDLSVNFPTASIDTVRGSLSKTITVIIKTWVRVPSQLESFRNQGLNLIRSSPTSRHLPIHWGMIMSVYPFWGKVAWQTGRLLRLQENVVAAQVQRRLREQLGERETVSRRVRYVLRSFHDWGVLNDTLTRGVYGQGPVMSVDDTKLVTWLIEAVLRVDNNAKRDLQALLRAPELFPFNLAPVPQDKLTCSGRLEVIRHGLDQNLVLLRGERGHA